MLKNLLVPMMLGRVERAAAQAACVLAERHGARVDVLVGLSAVSPLVVGWEYFPAGMYDTLDETARAAADALARDAGELLAGETAERVVEVARSFWLTPAEQSLARARISDLVVLGRSPEPQDAEARLFASLLLGSGRPLLLVPPDEGRRPDFERVVVAWKPTREAARAVHDALPLLRTAHAIDVLTMTGANEQQAETAKEGAQSLLRHLEAHGLKAAHVQQERGDGSTGDRILEYAQARRADLIVAGGYGHARAIEQVFGGVTHSLFRRSRIPVLLSH